MDSSDLALLSTPSLLYDDTVPYSEQLPTTVPEHTPAIDSHNDSSATVSTGVSLADRIGKGKLYLLSDVTASANTSRASKRKRTDETALEEESVTEEAGDMDTGGDRRSNAILLQGPPIAHLPTARIFAYATHFDANPIGLEWISDTTCILVFPSSTSAQSAYVALQKSKMVAGTHPAPENEEVLIVAKSVPMAFWPAEERINASLGKSEGLKGTIMMRWARIDDVKKRGAKDESEFYKKYGMDAGKEAEKWKKDLEVRMGLGGADGSNKRRRTEVDNDKKAELDRELEGFLNEESEDEVEEPPSKMRSDYLDGGRHAKRKTLLERTSSIRAHPPSSLADRLVARLPKRARRESSSEQIPREGNQRLPPVKRSQQELDDELDAFLNERG